MRAVTCKTQGSTTFALFILCVEKRKRKQQKSDISKTLQKWYISMHIMENEVFQVPPKSMQK